MATARGTLVSVWGSGSGRKSRNREFCKVYRFHDPCAGVGPAFPAPRIHPAGPGARILEPRRNETDGGGGGAWMEKPAFDWMLVPGESVWREGVIWENLE